MTNEQAIKDFEGTNENYRDQLSKYGYVMDKAEKDVVNQCIERGIFVELYATDRDAVNNENYIIYQVNLENL